MGRKKKTEECGVEWPESTRHTCVLPSGHAGGHVTGHGITWSSEPGRCDNASMDIGGRTYFCTLPRGHHAPHLDWISGERWVHPGETGAPSRCDVEVLVRLGSPSPRCSLASGHKGPHQALNGVLAWYPDEPARPTPVQQVRGRNKIAIAWHDVTCPEAEDCPDRWLHATGMPMVSTGVLERFCAKMAELGGHEMPPTPPRGFWG